MNLLAASLTSVIAHRGASGNAPENTIASLRAAAQLGARWVEVDAKLTADDEVILFHDDILDRTTNSKGLVAETFSQQIKQLDAGGWFSSKFLGEKIPTMMEAITLCAGLNIGMNIEIKPCAGREAETGRIVAEVVSKYIPSKASTPLFSSFSENALRSVRKIFPGAPQALLVNSIGDDKELLKLSKNYCFINTNVSNITKDAVVRINSHGMFAQAYTINDLQVAKQLFKWGVTSIFTDYPGRFPADISAQTIQTNET